jgi:hypothetical protein
MDEMVEIELKERQSDGSLRKVYKQFSIAARRYEEYDWHYQLADKSGLHNEGEWVPETSLAFVS